MSPILVNPSRFAVAAGGTALQTAMLADSPWGLWMSDEASGSTLADSSGNGRDLAISGAPSAYQVAIGGTSLKGITWPATTTDTAVSAVKPASTSDFTLEAFLFMASLPAATLVLISIADNATGTTNNEHVLSVSTNGTVTFRQFNGAARTLLGTNGSLTTSTLYHIVGVCSSTGGMRLRINKTTQNSNALNGANFGNRSVRIHSGLNAANAAGTIGPCAYYRTALTDTRIDAHFDAA